MPRLYEVPAEAVRRLLAACTSSHAQNYLPLSQVIHADIDNRAGAARSVSRGRARRPRARLGRAAASPTYSTRTGGGARWPSWRGAGYARHAALYLAAVVARGERCEDRDGAWRGCCTARTCWTTGARAREWSRGQASEV